MHFQTARPFAPHRAVRGADRPKAAGLSGGLPTAHEGKEQRRAYEKGIRVTHEGAGAEQLRQEKTGEQSDGRRTGIAALHKKKDKGEAADLSLIHI